MKGSTGAIDTIHAPVDAEHRQPSEGQASASMPDQMPLAKLLARFLPRSSSDASDSRVVASPMALDGKEGVAIAAASRAESK